MLKENEIANSGALKTKLYVPGKSSKDLQRDMGIEQSIKMSSNENPAGSSGKAVKALYESAACMNTYPDAESRDLCAALAKRFGCSEDEVTVGAGADGVLYNLAMALIEQGDEIVIPRITFPVYETTAHIMRGKPVFAPMNSLRINLDALAAAVTPATKMVFLCNPNNPTGDMLPPDNVTAFLKKIPSDVIIVLDEAYIEFSPPEQVPPSIELFNAGMKNLVILRTFSKLYGLAGLRVGYGICDETIARLIKRVKPPFDVSLPAERAALAALGDVEFGRETLRTCEEGKQYIYHELEAMNLDYVPSGTNFVLIDTGTDTDVTTALMKKGIIVRSAAGYGLGRWIRVTLGLKEANRKFIEALKQVLDTAD